MGIWDPTGGYNILTEGVPVAVFLIGDCNNSGSVDIKDLIIMAEYWLDPCDTDQSCAGCDIDETGMIDFEDFAGLSAEWSPDLP